MLIYSINKFHGSAPKKATKTDEMLENDDRFDNKKRDDITKDDRQTVTYGTQYYKNK